MALIKQWEAEIANKLKPDQGMSVYLLHGAHKKPYSELRKFDVVMTTYGTLASEFKRMELYKLQFKKTPEEYAEDIQLQKKCPLLHSKSRFWRIILDEAQCVKNENTQAAKAVSVLRSEHRWCLTGTPMMNGAHELFSLIRFLRIAPYNSATAFKSVSLGHIIELHMFLTKADLHICRLLVASRRRELQIVAWPRARQRPSSNFKLF